MLLLFFDLDFEWLWVNPWQFLQSICRFSNLLLNLLPSIWWRSNGIFSPIQESFLQISHLSSFIPLSISFFLSLEESIGVLSFKKTNTSFLLGAVLYPFAPIFPWYSIPFLFRCVSKVDGLHFNCLHIQFFGRFSDTHSLIWSSLSDMSFLIIVYIIHDGLKTTKSDKFKELYAKV